MPHIETDYLVIGAGASAMAFTDSLISASGNAEVVMVDRRDRPGGHWNDAYPFVRLHQPAAFYGVNSRQLGHDAIETSGPNAGMYEQSNAAEICDYFHRVMYETLLPSGRVTFHGMSDHTGHVDGRERIVSRLTGETTTVTVRKRVVDATYQETSIPKTHQPSFRVSPEAWSIPVNDLVSITDPPAGFVVLGSGKTAMDACAWLLRQGVDPDDIRWIRPRDTWLLNRAMTQPLDQVASTIEAISLDLEASANAETVDDVFHSLEAADRIFRIDPDVWPAMYRCATISGSELLELRTISNVVRLGHVTEIASHEIVLERGTIPTSPNHVHVDCTAGGLRTSPPRPIFEPGRIILQQIRTCQPTFNAALIAYVEATRDTDAEKNALCPPNQYPDTAVDMLRGILVSQQATNLWVGTPDVAKWMEHSRLNASRGVRHHLEEPRMQVYLGRYLSSIQPALANLERLLADA